MKWHWNLVCKYRNQSKKGDWIRAADDPVRERFRSFRRSQPWSHSPIGMSGSTSWETCGSWKRQWERRVTWWRQRPSSTWFNQRFPLRNRLKESLTISNAYLTSNPPRFRRICTRKISPTDSNNGRAILSLTTYTWSSWMSQNSRSTKCPPTTSYIISTNVSTLYKLKH